MIVLEIPQKRMECMWQDIDHHNFFPASLTRQQARQYGMPHILNTIEGDRACSNFA
jgi:hypothetical protein